MSYGRGKKDNEYARIVIGIDAPKTVWMAIALSLAKRLSANDTWDEARHFILNEWEALHVNGIVPQKPKTIRSVLDELTS